MKDGKYTIPDIHPPPSDPEVHPWTNNASKELQKQVLFFFATICFLKCNTGNAFVTDLLTIDKRFHPPIDFHVDLWVNLEGYRFYKMKTKQIGPKLLVVFFVRKSWLHWCIWFTQTLETRFSVNWSTINTRAVLVLNLHHTNHTYDDNKWRHTLLPTPTVRGHAEACPSTTYAKYLLPTPPPSPRWTGMFFFQPIRCQLGEGPLVAVTRNTYLLNSGHLSTISKTTQQIFLKLCIQA